MALDFSQQAVGSKLDFSSKAMDFSSKAVSTPEPTTTKPEETKPEEKGFFQSISDNPLSFVPGIAETLASGTVSTMEAAIEGMEGLTAVSLGASFKEGQEAGRKVMEPLAKAVEPETDVGKAATRILGKIPEAIHAAGEKTFEVTGSPLIGAATETALTASTFLFPKMLGMVKGKKVSPESISPETKVEKTVPTTPKEAHLDQPIQVNTPTDLGFELHRTVMAGLADTEESLQFVNKAEKEGITPEMRKEFRDYAEAKAAGVKVEKPQEFIDKYNKYSGALQDEINTVRERMGVSADQIQQDFSNRIAKRAAAWYDSISAERQAQVAGRTKGGFAKVPTSEKQRTVFSLSNGDIITVKPEKGKYKVTRWEDGNSYVMGYSDNPVKPGEQFNGMDIKQAQQKDIEQHTPIRYIDDDLMVKSMLLNSLKKAERERALIDNLKNSDFGKKLLVPADQTYNFPEGTRVLNDSAKSAFPAFRDYAMPAEYAEVLEDFADKYKDSGMLDTMNNAMIRSMMINPLPHIMNELVHWFDSRGASGFFSPVQITEASKGLAGLKYVPDAMKSVLSQDEFQRQLMREGGYLLYPSVKQQIAYKQAMQLGFKEVVKDAVSSKELNSIANALGMPVGRLLSNISDRSSSVMWAARDMMYTHLIKEQMSMGKTMTEAISEVGRHMPEYMLPSRIIGSRAVSRAMQSKAFVFSRYHYGLLKAIGENSKELAQVGKNNTEFAKGIDHALAIVLGMSIVYKGMDYLAQQTFGVDEAKQRRAGPYHLAERAYEVSTGEKDYPTLLQSILTPNPAMMSMGEIMANREAFTGQKIIKPGADTTEATLEAARFAGSQLAPVQSIQRNVEQRETSKQFLARMADIQLQDSRRERKARIIRQREIMRDKIELRKLRKQYGID